jgi:uncharacterized protein
MKNAGLLAVFALLVATQAGAQNTPDPTGDWRGTLQSGAVRLRLAMHLGEVSTFDSLDQGALGIPVRKTMEGRRLTLTIAQVGMFEGEMSDDGKTIAGTLKQGPASIPLVFERGAFAVANRPQTPVAPFPYQAEEVAYGNAQRPGVRLAGTLTLPSGPGPFAAVLLITGSGAQDRDQTIFEHKPFLVLADALTRRGVAVLRVDDRGIGGSTGATLNDTTADFATDVEAGVAWLKTRREIDPKRIGLLGHSEGGVIAPLVAGRDPSIAFIVLLAGPGVPGADVVVEQVRAIALAAGGSVVAAEQSAKIQRGVMSAVLGAGDAQGARAAVTAYLSRMGLPVPAEGAMLQITSDWYRHFIAHDPVPALRAIKVPVLALLGGKDVQVTAVQNKPALVEALQGNRDAQVIALPTLNHLFQAANTGAADEYAKITETISPGVLELVGDWVLLKAGGPR